MMPERSRKRFRVGFGSVVVPVDELSGTMYLLSDLPENEGKSEWVVRWELPRLRQVKNLLQFPGGRRDKDDYINNGIPPSVNTAIRELGEEFVLGLKTENLYKYEPGLMVLQRRPEDGLTLFFVTMFRLYVTQAQDDLLSYQKRESKAVRPDDFLEDLDGMANMLRPRDYAVAKIYSADWYKHQM